MSTPDPSRLFRGAAFNRPASPALVALLTSLSRTGAELPADELRAFDTSSTAGPAPALVQAALDAIPLARDGDVIASSYHNSLRDAVLLLARLQGGGTVDRTTIVTVPPAFVNDDANLAPWFIVPGVASKPAAAGNPPISTATGWLPLSLPDGARIQLLTVNGRREGAMASFVVALLRQTIASESQSPVTLISMELRDAERRFAEDGDINVPDAGPAAVEEYRVIDNSRYKYLLTATLLEAAVQSRVQINALQVVCTR
jgi:hypothetical protein